jgi:lipopolysaccharide biosynthesis regulator YciM
MFIRISFLSIIMFMVFFFYLYSLNPTEVTFQYLADRYVDTSLSVLLVGSFLVGAVLIFFAYSLRDLKRALRGRREKREREQLRDILYSATDALFKNDLAKAEKQIQTYLKKRTDDPNAYIKLAEIYQKGEKFKKAIDTLEKARLLKADQLEILFMEARVYKASKDYGGAVRIFKEIVAFNPNNREALRELRDIHSEEREWDDALRLQQRIIKLSPKGEIEQEKRLHQGLQYERARVTAEQGDTGKAIKEVKEILKENASFVPAQVLLGDLFKQTGKVKDAVSVWQRGFAKSHEMIFLSKLEDLYIAEEHPRAIINVYLDAMQKNPNNIVIPFFYARLCLRLEMIDDALDKLQEMEPNFSENPSYHYLLAEVYSHRGDHAQAALQYREGLRLEGGAATPYRCTVCQHEVKKWQPHCPQCGQWGTFSIAEEEEIKAPLGPLPSQLMAWDF